MPIFVGLARRAAQNPRPITGRPLLSMLGRMSGPCCRRRSRGSPVSASTLLKSVDGAFRFAAGDARLPDVAGVRCGLAVLPRCAGAAFGGVPSGVVCAAAAAASKVQTNPAMIATHKIFRMRMSSAGARNPAAFEPYLSPKCKTRPFKSSHDGRVAGSAKRIRYEAWPHTLELRMSDAIERAEQSKGEKVASDPATDPSPARRALAEAESRRVQRPAPASVPAEVAGRGGLDPARYGDWEVKGLASDF